MKKNSEISERISKLLEALNENPNSFARKMGYERSQTLYDVLNGKSAPSFDFFKKLYCTEFSELINFRWVFTGEGAGPINESSIVRNIDEGPPLNSGQPCVSCREKERIISSMRETINTQENCIDTLKRTLEILDICPSEGQKRKASASVSGK